MIKHIVMWKFKEGEEENIQKFRQELLALKDEISELKSIEVGININPKNEYQAVLISEFESMKDLEAYKTNPKHVKVSEFCKSIRIERVSVDFKEEEK